ncbi:zinc-binding dehydrogenase [Streptomyces niveiscabiei]|uniref:zinc-binding dehydrogenase n=1 Tax=Streptomyces niveiscabiei TaxID=164115 RepID=UPI0029A9F118|nr:zinc-binding dehydrogenase [Streptomyces niveiscabiei]MDX3386655.1 zinc-binding dehydrogenase [Streptomyces niveiscabiei]
MHAIRLHAFGPAENLTYEQTDDPHPAPGQVRIAVRASGVHLLDTALRQGVQGPAPTPTALPTIPGREVAGTVESLGEGVDRTWLGRRVVAHLGFAPGGYAELAVTDATRLHEIPDPLDEAQAVAMIGTGRTALGILQFATLTPASIAIIPAAAGGIGTLLVQYAKHRGATVIALAGGPAKTAQARANGADLSLDYTTPDWPHHLRTYLGPRRATIVLDGVGGEAARESTALLTPTGQHLIFGWSSQGVTNGTAYEVPGLSQHVLGPVMFEKTPLRTLETQALTEAATGTLTPAVHRFPLAKAAAAHRALETRRTTGKVVLEP